MVNPGLWFDPDASTPVWVRFGGPVRQRRWTILFRFLLAVPQVVVLEFMLIAGACVVIFSWFAALFTGTVPPSAAEFLTGVLRWQARVFAYLLLLTDRYPPFSLEAREDYPVDLWVHTGRLNRAAVFFRLILAVPANIVASVLTWGVGLLSLIVWVIALVLGRMPASLFQALAMVVRYQIRFYGYLGMLTSWYPAQVFGDGGLPPAPPWPGGGTAATGAWAGYGSTSADPRSGYGDGGPAGYGYGYGYGDPYGAGQPPAYPPPPPVHPGTSPPPPPTSPGQAPVYPPPPSSYPATPPPGPAPAPPPAVGSDPTVPPSPPPPPTGLPSLDIPPPPTAPPPGWPQAGPPPPPPPNQVPTGPQLPPPGTAPGTGHVPWSTAGATSAPAPVPGAVPSAVPGAVPTASPVSPVPAAGYDASASSPWHLVLSQAARRLVILFIVLGVVAEVGYQAVNLTVLHGFTGIEARVARSELDRSYNTLFAQMGTYNQSLTNCGEDVACRERAAGTLASDLQLYEDDIQDLVVPRAAQAELDAATSAAAAAASAMEQVAGAPPDAGEYGAAVDSSAYVQKLDDVVATAHAFDRALADES